MGLIGVGISMVVGIFCGEIFGGGNYIIEVGGSGLKVAQKVDFVGLVVVGRG